MIKNKTTTKKTSNDNKIIPEIDSELSGRILHVKIETDLEEKEDIDSLHSKIEEKIEKKLKEIGIKNCVVFVSGFNIELKLV